MADNLDIQLSSAHLKSALAQMKKRDIPPTPANFRVWYEYSEGENEELLVALSELIDNNLEFDAELNRKLYNRFFDELPHEKLKQFKLALKAITSELGIQLLSIAPDCSECERAIAEAEQKLSEGSELEALKKITSKLIAESRKAVEQNKQLGKVISTMNSKMSSLEVNLEKASQDALTDKLTGIANRRAFDDKLDKILNSKFSPGSICLLMLDIDHFKKFNDQHGHIMGDKVLRFVAQMIQKIIRERDFLARTGGEEFQLILEDCTLEQANALAEKIRSTIESARLTKGKERVYVGNVTLSIGVGTVVENETRNKLMNRIDKYLYNAKAEGRNRIVSEESTEPVPC